MVDSVGSPSFDGTIIAPVNKKLESRIDNAAKGPGIEIPEKDKDDDEKKKAAGANTSGRRTIVDISV